MEWHYTGANEREILNRHAVRFIFVQTGELGSFDFTSLLITMVTALGLLAVANTLTNLMMANVLDMRDLYKWHTMEVGSVCPLQGSYWLTTPIATPRGNHVYSHSPATSHHSLTPSLYKSVHVRGSHKMLSVCQYLLTMCQYLLSVYQYFLSVC